MKSVLKVMLMFFFSANLMAQMPAKEQREKFTPVQKAELLSKKMTLNLGLSDAQEKQVKSLFLERENLIQQKRAEIAKNKNTGIKPTKDERFAFRKEKLDNQISFERKMKKILSDSQFEKWKTIQQHRKHKAKKPRK